DMFEVGYSVIAASSSVGEQTADPPAHFFRPPQARTAMPLEQRITSAANIKTAYERGPPQTDRSIFDSPAMKSPRLSVGKLGWPKGVPRGGHEARPQAVAAASSPSLAAAALTMVATLRAARCCCRPSIQSSPCSTGRVMARQG